jgi:hypothetical protein
MNVTFEKHDSLLSRKKGMNGSKMCVLGQSNATLICKFTTNSFANGFQLIKSSLGLLPHET